jgi:hypothetical protein
MKFLDTLRAKDPKKNMIRDLDEKEYDVYLKYEQMSSLREISDDIKIIKIASVALVVIGLVITVMLFAR